MTDEVSSHSTVVSACCASPSPSGTVKAAGSAPVSSGGTVEMVGTITGFRSNG